MKQFVEKMKTRLVQPSTWLGMIGAIITIATTGVIDPVSLTAILTSLGLVVTNA